MISCIVLAAGLSRRFLSPKALAEFQGQTIIEHTQKMLIETALDEIVIVLGHEQERIKPHLLNHKKIKFVYNKNFNFGQTSSFQSGLKVLSPETSGVFLLPADYPVVKKSTINKLISHLDQMGHKNILIPTFQGKKGHPPCFSSSLFDEFAQLDISEGINTISHRHKDQVDWLEVDDSGVLETFNTQEEFKILKDRFTS